MSIRLYSAKPGEGMTLDAFLAIPQGRFSRAWAATFPKAKAEEYPDAFASFSRALQELDQRWPA